MPWGTWFSKGRQAAKQALLEQFPQQQAGYRHTSMAGYWNCVSSVGPAVMPNYYALSAAPLYPGPLFYQFTSTHTNHPPTQRGFKCRYCGNVYLEELRRQYINCPTCGGGWHA